MPKVARENTFPIILAVVSTAGYLYASVTMTVLDPLLKTLVTHPGGRTYPHAWMISPAAIALLFSTFLVTRYQPRFRVFLVGAPLALVAACSNLLIFPQEVPHMGILFITAVWILILALWTWTHDSYIAGVDDSLCDATSHPGVLEYLKEQASFYRSMAFGLVAAALALLVTAVVGLHGETKEAVSDPVEIALMNQFHDVSITLFMVLLFFGPIIEALRAWQRIGELLLRLRSAPP
jgi:hypothetical protein